MIMQMAQKKQISEEMLAPILARKAEMADAFARQNALQGAGQTPPTVMEQLMAQNAQAEQPQMPEQMPQQMAPQMPQQMPPQEMPQDMGVAQLPIPERQYAGGGIIAFADGGMSDYEDDDYEDSLEEADYDAMIERAMNAGEDDYTPTFETRHAKGSPQSFPNTGKDVGIASGREQAKQVTNEDQARRYNVGNLRPSGFTYPGQIGLSKGKFAMFDSPEAGLNALHHDIGIKLNRGLDTPTKFISVYAPEKDNNKVDVYSKNVANMLGIGPNDKIPNTPAARQLLANAIVRQEGAHKATAAFAHGGDVQHFASKGYVEENTEYDPFSGMPIGGAETYIPRSKTREIPAEYFMDLPEQRKAAAQANKNMISPKVVPPKMPPELQNVPVRSNTPTAQEFKDFDQAAALFQAENMGRNASTQAQETPKSRLDQYMEKMLAREAAMEARRGDDKNMALLTAGLGILGGTSPYAMANIGQGALAGVQNLREADKQRAAEQSALDKSMLYATRYQGVEDLAKQNALYQRGIKGAQLEETRRANTNKELEHAQANLNNYLKMQMDLYKSRFPTDEMPGAKEAMAAIYQRPEYKTLAQRAGYTIEQPTFAGFSAKMR
jgi:hypothetical protein